MRIKYSLGKTINLGNFQSARIDIGMEMDTETERIHSDMVDIKLFVKDELTKAIKNKDWE